MVRAYYMLDPVMDQFAQNQLEPSQEVLLDKLAKETGVLCSKVEVDPENQDKILQRVPQAAGCTYRDTIEISPENLGVDFEKKLAIFFDEHLHTDDEVRFILDGTGYFDVRDRNDRWIRIACEKGDFIVLPAGIYHRFTVDERRHLKAMRLFAGAPVWTPHSRSGKEADKLEAREKYRLNQRVAV